MSESCRVAGGWCESTQDAALTRSSRLPARGQQLPNRVTCIQIEDPLPGDTGFFLQLAE